MNVFMDNDGPHEPYTGQLSPDQYEMIGAMADAAYLALQYVTEPHMWPGFVAECEQAVPTGPPLSDRTRRFIRDQSGPLLRGLSDAAREAGNNAGGA